MTHAPVSGFDPADVQVLTDLAFVAAGRGAVPAADALAGGLACLRPGTATPGLIVALAHMNAGEPDTAAARLGSCPAADEPERQLLQAFLGLALQLAGRAAQGQRVLQAAAGQPAGRLARTMLGLRDGLAGASA